MNNCLLIDKRLIWLSKMVFFMAITRHKEVKVCGATAVAAATTKTRQKKETK